jgi:hypothetical protein
MSGIRYEEKDVLKTEYSETGYDFEGEDGNAHPEETHKEMTELLGATQSIFFPS